MTDKTIGQQLDEKLDGLATKADLEDWRISIVRDIADIINANTESLALALRDAGVPVAVRTGTRRG